MFQLNQLNQDKFGVREVFNLAVFDEEGDLVTVLNTLDSSFIDLNAGDHGIVFAKDALMDKDFMSFVSRKESKKTSDYERLLSSAREKDVFVLNSNPKNKKCKLIAKCFYRNTKDGEDTEVIYEIPNAKLISKYKFVHDTVLVGMFDYVFEILPYNNDNDTVKIHMGSTR